ncbi:MAG: VOC family protein [Acidobacteriota bacterium]|nr:VOC family protein [Acidobacteriota bacterium]MDE3163898.1 VOC family protein [Acidobacteriota bacterium]
MSWKLSTALFLSALTLAAAAEAPPTRPEITGISHLAEYTSNAAATEHYYRDIIGAAKEADPENPAGVRYALSATQFVEVLPLPAGAGINRLDHTAWNVTSAEGMRKYLVAKGWKTPAAVTKGSDGSQWFEVLDPEQNKVEFVQPAAHAKAPNAPSAVGTHIIHVGFMVHSRAAEDTFYRDLLGFRPYWFGGMQEGKLDWVSQQAPNGHDWLEYMLTSGPSGSGIPANMTLHALGVLDHLSIGVVSVPDAYKKLEASNRLTGMHDKEPKIGKDGKWQFNLYDPDEIRLELMNFHATEKPCCSAFTAADPEK